MVMGSPSVGVHVCKWSRGGGGGGGGERERERGGRNGKECLKW